MRASSSASCRRFSRCSRLSSARRSSWARWVLRPDAVVADVGDQLLDVGLPGVEVRPLVDARQKRRLPVLGFGDRVAARAHDEEAGQVLVLRAQAVKDPRAQAGPGLAGLAAVHEHERRLVIGHVGVH